MQDEQVQVVDAELACRFVPGMQCLLVAVVADPDFGFDEHLRTFQAGGSEAFTYFPFVAVRCGSVDVPVAEGLSVHPSSRWSGGSAGRNYPRTLVDVRIGYDSAPDAP